MHALKPNTHCPLTSQNTFHPPNLNDSNQSGLYESIAITRFKFIPFVMPVIIWKRTIYVWTFIVLHSRDCKYGFFNFLYDSPLKLIFINKSINIILVIFTKRFQLQDGSKLRKQ